ncbi:MAG: LysR family transcriptional regulator [Salaquimonas sp.]
MNHEPLDLSLLKSFLAVAQTGSFLRAADKVGRSPSAISMQIKRLEEALGKEVFTRNARDTKLTREGERLIEHARHLLAGEMEMRNAFRTEPVVGQILLGVPDDVIERFPMHVLSEFSDQYPDVSVAIRVGHTPSLLNEVERGEADLAIVTYVETIQGIEKAEIFYQEAEVWAARKGGVAAGKSPIPITLWDEGWGWYAKTKDILDKAKIDYKIVLHTENITARKNAIEADLCVGPLPISQLGDTLVSVPKLMKLQALPTYALGLVQHEGSSKAVDFLANYLKNNFSFGVKTKSIL